MKGLSLLLSIIVGVVSILAFREHLLETATALYSSFSFSNSTTTSTLETTAERPTTASETQKTPATNMSVPRAIRKVFLAVEQAEGAGARVRRSIGTPQLRNFSPFLMLDHFSIKPGAGFPDHPHRGQEVSTYLHHGLPASRLPPPLPNAPQCQAHHADHPGSRQTITYMLSGAVDHEDFAGNKGTIHAGDLQFMTAGRGIVHSEMPAQSADGSASAGLQLWVNLPRALKSCEPRYRDLRAAEVPAASADGGRVRVRVISGRSLGVDSVQDLAYTPVWLLDVTLAPGGRLAQELPAGFNAFAYTLEGTARFGGGGEAAREVPPFHNVVFEEGGDLVVAENDGGGDGDARFVIIAGKILDEPVVQYGPFVVNTKEEVMQAMFDYQTHSNGFERADGWASEIGKSMAH